MAKIGPYPKLVQVSHDSVKILFGAVKGFPKLTDQHAVIHGSGCSRYNITPVTRNDLHSCWKSLV